jgi:hypothetical protein
LWSNLQNAAAALTLANAGFNTTFNQTSAVNWKWANTTAATVSVPQNSPILALAGQYWATGAVTGEDKWTIQNVIAAGLNGVSTLTFGHSGSTGAQNINFAQGHGNLTWNGVNAVELTSNTGILVLNDGNASVTIGSGSVTFANQSLALASAALVEWNADTGISRLGAASLAIGNGTAGDKSGALSLSRINAFSADLAGSVTSSPTAIVAATVVVAVGGATGTFTVTSTEGFTVGDTVALSATGWTGGSGLASTTCTVTTITGGTTLVLTYVSGGPWVAGTYSTQTGTLTQTGVTSVTVTYKTAYTNTPFVVVTPTSNAGASYISAQGTAGFTITYANSGTQTFNYQVIGNQA